MPENKEASVESTAQEESSTVHPPKETAKTPTNSPEKKPMSKKSKIIWSIVTLLLIGFFLIPNNGEEKSDKIDFVTAMQEASTPEEKMAIYKDAVKNIDNDISEVNLTSTVDNRKTLSIFYTKDIAFKTIYTIGMNTQKMAQELVEQNRIDNQTDVLFFVRVPTLDNLGNEGTGLAMKIEWNGQTLNKIQWKNMFAPQFLNLAQYVEIRPLIKQEVVDLYQDVDSRNEYAHFLQEALGQ